MIICGRCGKKNWDCPQKCSRCKYEKHIDIATGNIAHPVVNTSASKETKKSKGKTAAELFKMETNNREIEGFEIFGTVSDNFTVLIYGGEGSGKSTFCIRFANHIAKNNSLYYFATEEGEESDTIIKRVQDNGINNPNITFFEDHEINLIVDRVITNKPKHVIIDSISEIKYKPEHLLILKKNISGIFIVISHANKKNDYAGARTLGHFFDIKLQANKGLVTSRKNRFGQIGKKYVVFEPDDEKEKKSIDCEQLIKGNF